jgi:branched-chain amino acid aminotransferase
MSIPQSEWIWFNGEYVPWEAATVHVTAHALHYGSSVFEGIRAYPGAGGPAVFCLDAHIQRLYDSCKLMRLEAPYTPEQVRQTIIELVRRNNHKDCYIRPLVYRGTGTLSLDGRVCPVEMMVLTFEMGRYLGPEATETGVDVMVSSWRRMAPDTFMAMTKAGGNYVNSQLMVMEAVDNGFVEAIALDAQGFVSEGSGENIFLVHRGILYTPPVSASILLGITRECVLGLARDLGVEVREQAIPREMLYIADEVFFTGTAAEITPVRSVDRITIGSGRIGPLTRRFQDEFFEIVFGKASDRHGWLTPVR